MAANLEKIVDQLSELSVLEAAELSKLLEEKWGVTAAAAAPVAVAAAGGDAGGAEEKTDFDVILEAAGGNKITGLGLKEAKDLVEAGGKAVKEGAPKAEADEIKAKLEAAGATVALK